MRIKVTVILFFVFVLNLSAQVNENDKYALTNSAFTFGSGDAKILDPYLSTFSYNGLTNMNATVEIQFVFILWRQNLRVQYGTQTPILGGMFVPHQGATYYEVFMLSNLTNSFHFSSLHNKIGWHQYLNIDIPTKINTIRFSIAHDYLIYGANDMVFKNNRLTFFVGSVMDLYVFSGTKRKTPSNFIKTYE